MVSDDERREVAKRLRSANEDSGSPDCELFISLYGNVRCSGMGCAECRRGAFDRLADLIEPSCDRDALLVIADEIDFEVEHSGSDVESGWASGIARRIREACGEVVR